MRIIAGKWKGRRLKGFKGSAIRPTSDRVRETLFNIIGPSIEGVLFLDLFSGSGAVGLEAMSRGAGHTTLVESDSSAIKLIMANIELCGLLQKDTLGYRKKFILIKKDVKTALAELARGKKSFDIVFLDPPYADRLHLPILSLILKGSLMKAGGLIVAEHSSRQALEFPDHRLMPVRSVKTGDTSFSFFEEKAQ